MLKGYDKAADSLASICVGTAVSHRQDAPLAVFQHITDLVWKLAVGRGKNAFAALACARGVSYGKRNTGRFKKVKNIVHVCCPIVFPPGTSMRVEHAVTCLECTVNEVWLCAFFSIRAFELQAVTQVLNCQSTSES